jgi:dihydrofolate synthase / folylpolyglutamate synthase
VSRTDAILERLLTLHPKLIDLNLDRLLRLLEDMGRPQDRLPPVIHVAGTNGKGSTIAFLRAFLEAAGKKVHVYISPHLVHFNERIRLAGTLVDEERLNAALEECERINAAQPITFFEITTAAAFKLFAEEPADFLLLEVGLGGEFDATNVIEHPHGVIITPVALDHQQFLGATIPEIAVAKAGILKRGSPAVFGRQDEEALRKTLMPKAARLGVQPWVAGEDFHGTAEDGRFIYQDEVRFDDFPMPKLLGAHQIDNAALAIAAVHAFDLPVDNAAIATGLRSVDWPARLTPLKGRLRDRLSSAQELWLDGSHNAHGATALARAIEEMALSRPAPLVLIVGLMSTRAPSDVLEPFRAMTPRVFALGIPGEENAHKPEAIVAAGEALGFETTAEPSLERALEKAGAIEGARIVICGSLYLAGHVLHENGTPPV